MPFQKDKLVEILGEWLSANGIDAKSVSLKVDWQNSEVAVMVDVVELSEDFTELRARLTEYVLVPKEEKSKHLACELKKARDKGAIFGFRLGLLAAAKGNTHFPEGLKGVEVDRIRELPKSLIMRSIRFNERLEREEEWIQRSE